MGIESLSTLVTQWPTDWILIGACAALAAFDALRGGSGRVAAAALALPTALLLYEKLPATAYLGPFIAQFASPLAQGALFAVIFVALYLFIRRIVGLWGESDGGPVQALIAGIACATVVVTTWMQVPALDSVWHFGPQVQLIFGEAYRFWWLLISFAGLAYVRS